jgi:hypothetical protein
MTHIRDGQLDDSETSEFGIGMKAAAICLCNKFTIVTKTEANYIKVEFDIIKMINETDTIKSFSPTYCAIITEDEYNKEHTNSEGSTIILSSIRPNILSTTNVSLISKIIESNISHTYSEIMKENKIDIIVNNNKVQILQTYFDDIKCKPFTKISKIYCLRKNDDYFYYVKNSSGNYKSYDPQTNKLIMCDNVQIKRQTITMKYEPFGTISFKENCCIIIETTFTYFSDDFEYINENDDEKEHLLPKNKVLIYKDNRRYTDFYQKSNSSKNYNISRLKFKSKKIGKEIGITFNKKFSLNEDIDLTNIIKLVIQDNGDSFSCDLSTKKFKELHLFAKQERLIKVTKNKIDIDLKLKKKQLIEPVKETPIKEPVKKTIKETPIKETPIKDPVKEPIDKPIKEPIKDPVKESIDKPIKETITDTIKEPVKENIKESSKEPIKKLVELIDQTTIDTVIELTDHSLKKTTDKLLIKYFYVTEKNGLLYIGNNLEQTNNFDLFLQLNITFFENFEINLKRKINAKEIEPNIFEITSKQMLREILDFYYSYNSLIKYN